MLHPSQIAADLFSQIPIPASRSERDAIPEPGDDRQVWAACQALGLDEELTAVVMERHRARADDSLIWAAMEFAAMTGWTRHMGEREMVASGQTARRVALAMQDYARALIHVGTTGRLPFQAE